MNVLPCHLGGAAPEPLRPETSGAGLEGHGGVAPKPPIPLALPKGIERLVFFIVLFAWRNEEDAPSAWRESTWRLAWMLLVPGMDAPSTWRN